MRVAVYSPLPPERSGIADYTALLLPALARRLDVAVARRGARRQPRADICLYHVGNDPEAHGWIVEALRRRPGVVVLHELVLHHLVAGLTIGRRDAGGYLDAMEREAGVPGRLLAHGVIDNRIPPLWETRPEDFPLAGPVLDAASEHGLIVHSRYVEQGARDAGFEGPIWRIAHPAWPVARPVARPAGRGPLVGCFGNLNPSKRIPELLTAFALVHARVPEARLLLAGAAAPRFDLQARLERLHPRTRAAVEWLDYVDEGRLWSLMGSCDVCVSLRAPTMGETSGSAIRSLALGRPLVVSDVGWFSELPDEVALKVTVDEHEVATLAAGLELLLTRPEVRSAMRDAAPAYVAREHDLERAADDYAAALEEAAGGRAVRDSVLREVAEAAAEVGIGPESRTAGELAARLRGAGLGG